MGHLNQLSNPMICSLSAKKSRRGSSSKPSALKRERDLSDLEAELEELENEEEDCEPKPKKKRGRKKGASGNRAKKEQSHLEDLPRDCMEFFSSLVVSRL